MRCVAGSTVTISRVIRLRGEIDRALANRWLRILLLVLLIGLFLLFVVHNTHDAAADGAAFGCLALVVLLFIVVPPHIVVRAVASVGAERKRGPPRFSRKDVGRGPPLVAAIPLRR